MDASAYGIAASSKTADLTIAPASRYFAGISFLPSRDVWWQQSVISYRALYDQHVPSLSSNYAGAAIDSILMFGGHNGASGIIYDGSSGGMLNDMWNVRLANWSTDGRRERQQQYMDKHCAWRSKQNPERSCLLGTTGATCRFRDLLMAVWCGLSTTTSSYYN